MRDKYSQAILTAKNLRFNGNAEERDGRLHFNGTVNSQDEANQIWTALKTVPDWQKDIVADIKVVPQAAGAAVGTSGSTYTVQAGDTLSGIAKKHLGVFNANRDQLTDPDKIKPGQVLKMP
jgi:nucleoid-associated protein YgaU